MSKWILTDPATAETYEFEISVTAGGDVTLRRSVDDGADGDAPVVTTKQTDLRTEQATGTLVSEAQYNALVSWFEKGGVIELTDQLGRVSQVVLTQFSPERQWSADTPWKHPYTLSYAVVG